MPVKAQRSAQGKPVQHQVLFLQGHVGHVELFHVHVPLPVSVAAQGQAKALVNGADQAGAVLHVHHAAPTVGVAQVPQGHHGNVLFRQGQIALADLGGLRDQRHLLCVAAVAVPHRQVGHMVMEGGAVAHQLVRLQLRDQLQRRPHGEHPAGGLRRGVGRVGIHLIAIHHQQLFRGQVPRGKPLLLVGADRHIFRRHPAGTALHAGQIVFSVR